MNEKTILINVEDIDMKILLDMDIDTLSNVCITNKTAKNICNKPAFWRTKFKKDDIPYKEFTSIRDMIKHYKQGYIIKIKYPNNTDYTEQYEKIEYFYTLAKNIIIISDVINKEYHNIFIGVGDTTYYQIAYHIIAKWFPEVDFTEIFDKCEIIRMKYYDDEYYVFFSPDVDREYNDVVLYNTEYTYLEDDVNAYQDEYRIQITYEEFLYFFMIILYDENYYNIWDTADVSFLPDSLNIYDPNDARRLGQWDMINYFQK